MILIRKWYVEIFQLNEYRSIGLFVLRLTEWQYYRRKVGIDQLAIER